ncbi:MAG: SPOR domain-containing protein, partial [Proteobacteria bacterium]|nr:SPOR domain-containing protein [Pseudomonadota bacterium]
VNAEDRSVPPKKPGQPRWGRRLLTLLIATAAIGGFAVVVLYSYEKGQTANNNTTVPIITAQKGPTKMRPKEPGGMVVPNQDKQVYGRLNVAERRDKVERLLPPPETIVRKPPALLPDSKPSNPVAMVEKTTEQIVKRLSAIAPAAGNSTARPTMPGSAKVAAKPEQKSTKVARLSAPMKKAARPSGTIFRIQLASVRSQKAAEKAWGGYKFNHSALFAKLEPKIVRVDLKGKGTYFRLQAGPFANESAARSLCAQAKKKKLGCIIVRP